ncbi:MAG: hypothetical protein R3D71_08655 [Rickettsiales bacterium]
MIADSLRQQFDEIINDPNAVNVGTHLIGGDKARRLWHILAREGAVNLRQVTNSDDFDGRGSFNIFAEPEKGNLAVGERYEQKGEEDPANLKIAADIAQAQAHIAQILNKHPELAKEIDTSILSINPFAAAGNSRELLALKSVVISVQSHLESDEDNHDHGDEHDPEKEALKFVAVAGSGSYMLASNNPTHSRVISDGFENIVFSSAGEEVSLASLGSLTHNSHAGLSIENLAVALV